MTEQTTTAPEPGRHAATLPASTSALVAYGFAAEARAARWRQEAAETRSALRNPELARPRAYPGPFLGEQ